MRRVFWATLGAGFGFGISFWTMRALRRVADRVLPTGMLERVGRVLDAMDGGTGTRRVRVLEAGARAADRNPAALFARVTTPRAGALAGGHGTSHRR